MPSAMGAAPTHVGTAKGKASPLGTCTMHSAQEAVAVSKKNNIDFIALRQRHNLNQTEFWKRVGVSQSGGSRYESGRKPGPSVMKLIRLVYGTKAERERELKDLGLK